MFLSSHVEIMSDVFELVLSCCNLTAPANICNLRTACVIKVTVIEMSTNANGRY